MVDQFKDTGEGQSEENIDPNEPKYNGTRYDMDPHLIFYSTVPIRDRIDAIPTGRPSKAQIPKFGNDGEELAEMMPNLEPQKPSSKPQLSLKTRLNPSYQHLERPRSYPTSPPKGSEGTGDG